MGVTGYANECFIENFTKIINDEEPQLGLLVGHRVCDEVYLTHIFALPENGNDGPVLRKKKKSKDFDFLSLEEDLVTSHACQVVRMIPGGLDIVGVYVILESVKLDDTAVQGKLKSILTSLSKAATNYFLGTHETPSEQVVLFGCPETQKYGIKSIDLSTHGSQLVGASFKYREVNWVALKFSYNLKYSIFFPVEKKLQSLRKSVLTEMIPWAKSLDENTFLVDNTQYQDEDLLFKDAIEQTSSAKKKQKSSQLPEQFKTADVMILESSGSRSTTKDEEDGSLKEFSGCVFFSGTVAGKAFVKTETPMSEVVNAVKKDLIRSFVSRWEMHCDSLVEEPQGSSSGSVLHEPPRRVFFKDPNSSFTFCDYLFPGDSVADTCQSSEEVLGLSIKPSDVVDTLEVWADPEEFRVDEETSRDKGKACDYLKQVCWLKRSNSVQVLLAIIFAILAMFISYYVMVQKQ